MIQRFSTNFAVFSVFFDYVLILLNFYGIRYLRPLLSRLPFVRIMFIPPEIPFFLYILIPTTWVMLLFFLTVYDGKKNLRIIDEFSNLTVASVIAMVIISGILFFTYRDISRVMIVIFYFFTFITLLSWRLVARLAYKVRIDEKGYRTKVFIVGNEEAVRSLREQFNHLNVYNVDIIGWVDQESKQITLVENKRDLKVFDFPEEIRELVEKYNINHILLAIPPDDIQTIRFVIRQTENMPIRISLVPDYFNLTIHSMVMKNLAGIPVLELRASSLSEYQRLTKRIFDLIISTIMIVLCIPVLLMISLLILISEGRPIFFIQKRVGENSEFFRMIKFRTMKAGADNQNGSHQHHDEFGRIIYKVENDPRVTNIGRVLRRLSLDELPQLFNVIRGTMSLVGPRPELPEIVQTYESWQRVRLSVPQGITGWWQVNGRSDTPLHLNIEKDIYYIENYSIWLDVSILIKTVWIILRGKGAY